MGNEIKLNTAGEVAPVDEEGALLEVTQEFLGCIQDRRRCFEVRTITGCGTDLCHCSDSCGIQSGYNADGCCSVLH